MPPPIKHLICLVVFGLFVVQSCNKEDIIVPLEEKGFNENFSIGSLEDFKELSKYVNENLNKHGKNGGISKSRFEKENDFRIVNNGIQKIIDEYGVTFTIKILRKNQRRNRFSNLIVRFYDNHSHAFIINYSPTNQFINNIKSNPSIPFEGKWSYEPLEYIGELDYLNHRLTCKTIGTTYCNYPSGDDEDRHNATSNCTALYTYTMYQKVCVSELEYDDSNGTIDSGDSSAPYGNGGGGTGPSIPITNPISLEECDYTLSLDGVNSETEECQYAENAYYLHEALEDDPYLLLEINCDQIQYWQTLAQHTAPQSVLEKIDNLSSSNFNEFEIQPLDEAGGTIVNMDYFAVSITTLPINPNTGQRFTADGLLNHMRLNFNDFVEDTTFDPYCEISSMCETETNTWNSNNPVGSILYIDIPGDDGVVVCTEYTNRYWYFMTMNAPFAGNHPVSGTRQFGYEQKIDGSYNFFVRGVDRFDSNIIENLAYVRGFGNPFFGSDDLWESFQANTKEFINNNGGSSTTIRSTINRPDWDEVERVLNGDLPIGALGCD